MTVPAEAALDALSVRGLLAGRISEGDHLFLLLQLLLVQLFRGLLHFLTSEILDSEFNSSKLYDIELFDFVVLKKKGC